MPDVITIPALDRKTVLKSRLRVATYCRVSSLSSDQADSFVNQTIYYTNLINTKPEWEFAGIYADRGITGTKKERKEFKKLINDCKQGKIDLILIKSISRFARNTIDCLEIVEDLRRYGVYILFEKDNINTKDRKSDIMLSILGSCAQQESISTSHNLKLGVRARMEAGIYRPAAFSYGYQSSDVEFMQLDPATCKIALRILKEYKYQGYVAIKDGLNRDKIPCKFADKWTTSIIRSIIKNEKFMGDALLQKTYSPETFPFRKNINHGEVRQVYYKNSHPALISKIEYDENQKIMAYEKFNNGIDPTKVNYHNRYTFSGKIYCQKCSSKFRRKVANKKTVTWSCMNHLESKDLCDCKSIKDDELKYCFIELCGKLRTNPNILTSIIKDAKAFNTNQPCHSHDTLNRIKTLKEQSLILSRKLSAREIDFALFLQEQNTLEIELEFLLPQIQNSNPNKSDLIEQTDTIIKVLNSSDFVQDSFCDEIFNQIIDKVLISNNSIEFILINGLHLHETLGGI